MKRHWVVCLGLLLSSHTAAANPSWTIQPSTTLANLYGVAHGDPGVWVAVGDAGLILRSTDDGATWASVTSPVGEQLRAVSMHGALGIAVGIAGRVARTTDGGANWTQVPRFTTRSLYGVSVGAGVAVITGEEGQIFSSIDDGATWQLHTAGTASVLFGVSVCGSTGVGVGGQGAIVMSDNPAAGWGLTLMGQLVFFYGTSFATPTTWWAVGTSSTIGSLIIKSTSSGFTWSPQTAPTSQTLTGVSFTSVDTGTAVGFAGTILRTLDGGATWTPQDGNVTRNLNAVSFADPLFGIAVGDTGTILRTTTGGAGVGSAGSSSPTLAIHPNPVRQRATVGFRLPRATRVRLGLFDVSGARVASLVDGPLDAGWHDVAFDARGVRSGVYFYRLETGVPAQPAIQRVLVVR